jgi:hypothetical protein
MAEPIYVVIANTSLIKVANTKQSTNRSSAVQERSLYEGRMRAWTRAA